MRWEIRGLLHHQEIAKRYDDREQAYEAFGTMVRSDPSWLELYEIEDGHGPRRLRRYEIPHIVTKRGPGGRKRRDA
jgi:hypothetical protein